MQVIDYLRRLPLFSDLTEGEMLDVLRIAKVVRFKAGEYLCRLGEPGPSMYLIESGSASVRVPRPGKPPLEVRVLGAGQVIGELALVDNEPRSADVVALEDVQAYEINRVEFNKLRAQLNPAAFKILRHVALTVSERLRELNDFATGGLESGVRPPVGKTDTPSAPPTWRRLFSSLRRSGS